MRNWKSLVLMSFLLLQPAIADAGIMMAFTGTSGSSEITLTMSGTGTFSSGVSGGFTAFFNPQDWFTQTVLDPFFGVVMPIDTSIVNLSGNLEFRNASDNALRGRFDQIRGLNTPIGDGWGLYSPSVDVNIGDTVIASGSATFTLGNGFTIDSIPNGTYLSLDPYTDGGVPVTLTWNASPVAAVPEPSSMFILALGSVAMGLHRVRRQPRGVMAPATSAAAKAEHELG